MKSEVRSQKSEAVMLEQLAVLARQVRGEVDAQTAEIRKQKPEDLFKTNPNRRERRDFHRRYDVRSGCRSTVPSPQSAVQPRKGEIKFREFIRAESARVGVSEPVIYQRFAAGQYPGVKMRRINERLAFVRVKSVRAVLPSRPRKGEILLKDFAAHEAGRLGITLPAVYNRLSRGKYPGLKCRRVNDRTIFVRGMGVAK